MSCTRWSIGEQVQLMLNGGAGKEASQADIRELYKSIEQVANGLLKVDYFKTTLDAGETVPDGMSLATYDNIPVIPYKNVSKLTLPANYLKLPRNLGVFFIGPSNVADGTDILSTQFIPIPMGMSVMLKGQPMIESLLGQIGYEVHGLDVIFKTDITKSPYAIAACLVKLVVLDMSQYGDYDILPLPADMEFQCVQAVYQLFSGEKPASKIDDPITVKPAVQ